MLSIAESEQLFAYMRAIGEVKRADTANFSATQPAFDLASCDGRMPVRQAVEVANYLPDRLDRRRSRRLHMPWPHSPPNV